MLQKNLCLCQKQNNFAIPAVNCVGSDSVNAVLETAARVKAPVIIQFSNGGAAFYAGKGIKPTSGARPDVLGAIAGAKHVHTFSQRIRCSCYSSH